MWSRKPNKLLKKTLKRILVIFHLKIDFPTFPYDLHSYLFSQEPSAFLRACLLGEFLPSTSLTYRHICIGDIYIVESVFST